MKHKIINWDNKAVGEVSLDPSIFEQDATREDIIHKVVVWQLAKRRSGSHKTKEIGEVRGSTRKIYRQKGTGGARHGSSRGAQFRGGGIIFGPKVREYGGRLNKKLKSLALKVVLSIKQAQKSIIVLDNAAVGAPKTSEMKKRLMSIGAGESCLILDAKANENTKKSVANLHNIDVLPVVGMNVYDIYRHDKLVLTSDALVAIEERFKK